MYFKIINEPGDYLDATTNEDRNLLDAETWVATPDGLNIGWVEYATLDEAITGFNLKIKPV